MANRAGLRSIVGLLLVAMPMSVAASPGDDCTVLDFAFRQARTEFPALKNRQFGGARCKYRANEFTCDWGFPTDRYGDAEAQIGRLERCTAAEPEARLIEKKRYRTTYQLGPDTRVMIGGPNPNDGDWAIELKITSSADSK